ncbi:hypothetical protein PVAP13_9KG076300 [Panicum virgatum]|uniref:Uncharacterized protein n=1 Tax=Panicum virgatum TaxID=38727 RepID=A0A8T0NCZ6_PANVG|nr:hypothetical protein PVAP13_9KG076300 [Panicum virgatum]
MVLGSGTSVSALGTGGVHGARRRRRGERGPDNGKLAAVSPPLPSINLALAFRPDTRRPAHHRLTASPKGRGGGTSSEIGATCSLARWS